MVGGIAALLPAAGAQARPGDLDGTFSRDGIVHVALGLDSIDSLGVQSDGSIVIGGVDGGGGDDRAYVVARYRPDGSLDTTFGHEGVVRVGSPIYGVPSRMALSGDRILLAGTVGAITDDTDLALARLLPDGAVDPSFGDAGTARISFPGFDVFGAFATTADGGVLIAGYGAAPGQPLELRLGRLDANGKPEAAFSDDGQQAIDTGTAFRARSVSAATAAGDGSVYVASGSLGIFDDLARAQVLRLSPGGDPDPTYGDSGIATAAGDPPQNVADLAIDPQGRIVFGGAPCAGLHPACFGVAGRFTAAGVPDPGFGESGTLRYPDEVGAVAPTPDGGVLLAGSQSAPGPDSRALLQLLGPDATPLEGFGNRGLVPTETGSGGFVDVAHEPDGRIVASSAGAIARYEVGPGPANADADRLLDARDRCPYRFARHASGCPEVKRTLSFGRAQGRSVRGRLTVRSESRRCAADQPIVLVAERRVLDRTRTSLSGRWQLDRDDAEGPLSVVAKQTIRPWLGRCRREAIRIPAD